MIGGLVLAAGAGRRFGGRKQLAPLRGRPLLEHVLATAAAAPLDRVVVVLGADAGEVRARVRLHGAEPVACAQWADGQAASLRAGAEVLLAAGAEAAVVLLGDQPLLSPAAVRRVAAARDPARFDAVRATYGGRPGHPVLLERPLLTRVDELHGEEGARALLGSVAVLDVDCDGLGSPDDVDTPEALEVMDR